ncbi:MAG: protein kinase [Anaerolineae bacterium]|nr:protein kinase [Anaerolineae bacterium]
MSVEIGQILKGRYRIQSILGEGGMGTVYLAQDTWLDRPRAIKELYSDPLADEAKLIAARKQFEREAKALMQLRHKNLPHVNDYFSIDENDYLVMDYIEGESLADILKSKKRPTEALMYTWLEQILDALSYCHSQNVVHRDIKPANIVLTPEGRVMLVDFGLVKIVDPHNPRTATIVHGLGTPEYTPLEQYDPSMGHTDERSDIYALGATMYHLLTGHSPQPVSQRILRPDTQPDMRELNPKISTWIVAFVRRAMAIRPENRYQNVGEMQRDLQARVFKVKQQTRTATPRTPQQTTQPASPGMPPHRAHQTEQRQYRFGSSQPKQTAKRATNQQPATQSTPPTPPEAKPLAPLAQMAIPVMTISAVVAVVVLLSVASSSFWGAMLVFVPLILGGLAYGQFIAGRHRRPPRF